jgi:hypothetical protein
MNGRRLTWSSRVAANANDARPWLGHSRLLRNDDRATFFRRTNNYPAPARDNAIGTNADGT